MAESTTDSKPLDDYPHILAVHRYSWGSNMDHSESWLLCTVCRDTLMHSDFDDYFDEDEAAAAFDEHATTACARRVAQRLTMRPTYSLAPSDDDEPF